MARKKQGPPRRTMDEEASDRDHLSEEEVKRLRDAAGRLGRNGRRDAAMVWMAFRHGLRASELVRLRWEDIHFDQEDVFVRRRKGSTSGMHLLADDEAGMLRKLGTDRKGWVFKTEGKSGGHVSESGFRKIVARAGEEAGFEFHAHPHQLRHACGYAMNREGQSTRTIQAWLGHVNIQNTVLYTRLDADHFRREKVWGGGRR